MELEGAEGLSHTLQDFDFKPSSSKTVRRMSPNGCKGHILRSHIMF